MLTCVASPLSPTFDPMAAQMTKLLLESDVDELREIVRRWLQEAPAGGSRRVYEEMGSRLLELKEALASQPIKPTAEELQAALTMMLRLAASEGPKR